MKHHSRLAVAAATMWLLSRASPLAAQLGGTLDFGASWVDYEGFLGSGAAFMTPTLRYDAPTANFAASGNYVVFESGNHVLQALTAGGWRTKLSSSIRVELSGSAGVNKYQDYPGYGHFLARTRLHLTANRSGMWIGGATGQSWFASASATPYQVELGGWFVYQGLSLSATGTRTWFADSAYVDAVGTALYRDASFEVTGTLGFRAWSQGGGEGMYGEILTQIPVWRRLALLASGGRYPSDPVRGVIPANYVSAGLRIHLSQPRQYTAARTEGVFEGFGDAESPEAGDAQLTIATSTDDRRVIRVTAPGARSVTIAGDFTDWQPVTLMHVDSDRWEIGWQIPTGVYRVSVRLGEDRWVVPLGLRVEEDEFGGRVGVLVVGR